jgi:hypothetical protein
MGGTQSSITNQEITNSIRTELTNVVKNQVKILNDTRITVQNSVINNHNATVGAGNVADQSTDINLVGSSGKYNIIIDSAAVQSSDFDALVQITADTELSTKVANATANSVDNDANNKQAVQAGLVAENILDKEKSKKLDGELNAAIDAAKDVINNGMNALTGRNVNEEVNMIIKNITENVVTNITENNTDITNTLYQTFINNFVNNQNASCESRNICDQSTRINVLNDKSELTVDLDKSCNQFSLAKCFLTSGVTTDAFSEAVNTVMNDNKNTTVNDQLAKTDMDVKNTIKNTETFTATSLLAYLSGFWILVVIIICAILFVAYKVLTGAAGSGKGGDKESGKSSFLFMMMFILTIISSVVLMVASGAVWRNNNAMKEENRTAKTKETARDQNKKTFVPTAIGMLVATWLLSFGSMYIGGLFAGNTLKQLIGAILAIAGTGLFGKAIKDWMDVKDKKFVDPTTSAGVPTAPEKFTNEPTTIAVNINPPVITTSASVFIPPEEQEIKPLILTLKDGSTVTFDDTTTPGYSEKMRKVIQHATNVFRCEDPNNPSITLNEDGTCNFQA